MRVRMVTAALLVLACAFPVFSAEKQGAPAQTKPGKKSAPAQAPKKSQPAQDTGRSGAPQIFETAELASADGRLLVRAPKRVEQGGVALLRLVSAEAVPSAMVQWNGKRLSLIMRPDGLGGVESEALLPVPVDAAPGKALALEVKAGSRMVAVQIPVRAVNWPRQEITVEEKYVTPPKAVSDRIAAEREKVNALLATVSPETRWDAPFARPVPGEPSSVFGGRRIFNGQPRSMHRGVDLRGAEGTEIKALAAGRVAIAEEHYFSGNVVFLDHGQGFITLYAHMSAFAVKPGDFVEEGQTIGLVGATGRVTGPHLHLGALLRGQAVNPLALLTLE